MARQLVKGVISNIDLSLVDVTGIGDRYRTLVPAEIQIFGKGWLDDGTEVNLGMIRISPERDKELRNLFDAIIADLLQGEADNGSDC